VIKFKEKINKLLFEQISPVTLGIFRIGLGILLFIQFDRVRFYFTENLVNSKYYLKYDFFNWVEITSVDTLNLLFSLSLAASVLITVGFLFRIASVYAFFFWTYLFLLDQGHYNNHYYFLILLLFVLIFTKADTWGSIKSLYKKPTNIPCWNVNIPIALLIILYVFGAIAKMDSDWLNGYPLKFWLSGRYEWGEYEHVLEHPFFTYFMAYFGLIFDLLIGFILLHKKWRWLGLALVLGFHISNHFLWVIGIFPWLSIWFTILFFSDKIEALFKNKTFSKFTIKPITKKVTTISIGIFIGIQLLFPFRQHFYADNTNWHGYGQFFAWRMMLADRQGAIRMRLYDQDNTPIGEVALEHYINERQIFKLVFIPKNMLKFCHFIENEILSDPRNEGVLSDVKIYVDIFKTVNNRPYARVIDPNIDLTSIEYQIFSKGSYILPFENTEIKEEYDVITEEEFQFFIE